MDWFWWLFGGLSALFTILGLLLIGNGEEDAGQKLLAGWWGGVLMVTVTVLALTFVIKPVLAFIWDLIF